MKDTSLTVTTKTILITLLVMFLIWVTYLLLDVVLAIFLSLILALTLEPLVDFFRSKRIPHSLSVVIVVLTALFLVIGLASIAVTPFIQQSQYLIANFPKYLESLGNIRGMEKYAAELNNAIFSQISNSTNNVITATIDVVSGIGTGFVVLVFTVYILLDFTNLRRLFISAFHPNQQPDVQLTVNEVERKLGNWLRGQLLLMLIIGSLTFIGLTILGIENALPLAVLAGLLEIIPIIGPLISLIPAAIVGFSDSSLTGFAVIGLYILIQQFEGQLIVPKVMQKAVGLNPLVTLLAILVGSKLFGVIGVFLAVPLTIVLIEVLNKTLKSSELSQFTKSPRTAG